MCVIERTSKRVATRKPEAGVICATNDYRLLTSKSLNETGELRATSDGRYSRISELILDKPNTLEKCVEYLSDPKVKMGHMTVQQMAFSVGRRELFWRIPQAY